MKKALLTEKDQILLKILLFEKVEKTGVLNKYIASDDLDELYDGMYELVGKKVIISNITNMSSYNRLSFFYESIVHDLAKYYKVEEKVLRDIILNNGDSINKIRGSLEYYNLTKDYSELTNTNIINFDNKEKEAIGYRSGF